MCPLFWIMLMVTFFFADGGFFDQRPVFSGDVAAAP